MSLEAVVIFNEYLHSIHLVVHMWLAVTTIYFDVCLSYYTASTEIKRVFPMDDLNQSDVVFMCSSHTWSSDN